jgi:hypothetical protein
MSRSSGRWSASPASSSWRYSNTAAAPADPPARPRLNVGEDRCADRLHLAHQRGVYARQRRQNSALAPQILPHAIAAGDQARRVGPMIPASFK